MELKRQIFYTDTASQNLRKDFVMRPDKPKSKPKNSAGIRNCCVSDIGLTGFAECQMAGPNQCPYAMPFGYSFLCQHPHLDRIVAQSKQKQAAAILK